MYWWCWSFCDVEEPGRAAPRSSCPSRALPPVGSCCNNQQLVKRITLPFLWKVQTRMQAILFWQLTSLQDHNRGTLLQKDYSRSWAGWSAKNNICKLYLFPVYQKLAHHCQQLHFFDFYIFVLSLYFYTKGGPILLPSKLRIRFCECELAIAKVAPGTWTASYLV